MVRPTKSANRLRNDFQKRPLKFGEVRVPVTLSAGVAVFDDKSQIDAVVRQADHRLYEAKRAGRNRVVSDDVARMGGSGVSVPSRGA